MTHTLTVKQNYLTSNINKLYQKVVSYFGTTLEKSQQKALYRKTVKELSKMSDRDLADIGINRYDIPFIAAEVYEGKTK